jgi:alkylation response protein AidB-like acyl-CoA dehydrogenase
MSTHSADDIEQLRHAARGFLNRDAQPKRTSDRRGRAPGLDRAAWRKAAELGWPGLLISEAHGGSDMGLIAMAALLEEIGRALAPLPLAAVALAGSVLRHAAPSPLTRRLLAGLAAGDLVPALAWQERPDTIDPTAIETTAIVKGKSAKLSGVKRHVAGADGADGFIVSAMANSRVNLYWLEAGASGLEVSFNRLADGSVAATLRLTDAVASAENPIATNADAVLAQALDEATVMASAELLGIMRQALDITLAYLRTRVQFDKPIGGFQALQHRAVDLFVLAEISRAALDAALAVLDGQPAASERAAAASRVKSRCSDAALRITQQAVQLHGAIGFTDECDIGLYLNRALVLSAWLGNGAMHRRRYAQLMPAEAA